MKLWQKIFLITLAFVMIAVGITTVIVAQNYFEMTLDIEKQGATAHHEYVTSVISNRVTLEGLSSNELVIAEDNLRTLLRSIVTAQADEAHGIAVYDEKGEIAFSQIGSLSTLKDFRNKVENNTSSYSVISDYSGTKQLMIGSSCELSGRKYYLYTSTDISRIYQTREQVFIYVRIIGAVSAVATATVLLFLVYKMLSPLSKINMSIHRIAKGSYSERVPEEGGYEFKELTANINQMAGAIEENVGHLQEIADSRKRFIDNLAHEMKTPLTSIICLSDVMHIKKNLTEEERIEYSGIIVDEAKRLRNLSGKILELTVAGNAELDYQIIQLTDILSSVYATTQPVFERSNMTLIVEPVKCVIRCDRELFTSLLLNLIENARKASAEGDTVEVKCKLNNGNLSISVIDHGIGMSEEELKHISEPFYMADKSRSRQAGGAGLGLSLCTEIAKRHQAKLKYNSTLGEGTVVTLTMPTGGEPNA